MHCKPKHNRSKLHSIHSFIQMSFVVQLAGKIGPFSADYSLTIKLIGSQGIVIELRMIKSFINKVAAIQWVKDASLRNKYYSTASSGSTDPIRVECN
ncbi:hypothetical protein KQX54_008279 [Cotesia glomerata]|uniref:Uncharacterized protein n=1 Tax=Cotesia glomerata TaxID=32391 RepID=A0AAV7HSV1_COTGL|nr:hypothetical protein KQX54_008279 [Cotesia glomerata]